MDGPVGREVANVGIVSALFLAGGVVGGPVGAVVGGIAGEMAAGLVERGWAGARDRFLGGQGVRQPDLRNAMAHAYFEAISNLEARWSQLRRAEGRPGAAEADGGARGLFELMRADAALVLGEGRLSAIADDPAALRALGSGDLARGLLRAYLEALLRLHDEGLRVFVLGAFEPELAASFANQLAIDRAENNRAWRAYQRLVLDALQSGLTALGDGQGQLVDRLGDLSARLEAWGERLDAVAAEVRERTGEAALALLVERLRNHLDAVITEQAATTRDVVVAQGEATRVALEVVGQDVRAIRQAVEREAHSGPGDRPRLVVPDVLLRGPVEALDLGADLDRAAALDDRRAAADLYEGVARRLADAGYPFHARLIRERRAEALVAAGTVADAYALWLDDAAAALEAGELYLPSAAAQGLDAHRADVGPVLAARADALEAAERWYEQPAVAASALRRSLGTLEGTADAWAPVVCRWLGEAVVVDGWAVLAEVEEVRAAAVRLAPAADEATAIRLRLLAAELGGDWGDLPRQAATGRLGTADAGLVLSRYGRWLALEARPEEATDAYRQAVEKLAQARLLGDAAGALRAIAALQIKYTGELEEAQQTFELARTVAAEPTRLERRRDARNVGVDALWSRQLPDAYRSLRRYLWEARLAGHLHNELDAQQLIGDLFAAAQESGAAIAAYVRAGLAKKAAAIAEELTAAMSLVDVDAELEQRAPWMVGAALAVISAQGDLLPSARVERLAPRLLDLTAGVRQGIFAPQVDVEAWKALAAVALQFPAALVDAVLDRSESIVERGPDHYRRTDDSLLRILVRLYRFRPERRGRVSALIARCLGYPDLADRLWPFLTDVSGSDEALKNAVVGLAEGGDRAALRVLAVSAVAHPAVRSAAAARAAAVLAHEVGVERHELSITTAFEDAARFASFLPEPRREELARHLLAIAADVLSPGPYRSSAAEALGILAEDLDDDLRAEAFEAMLPLTGSAPSAHPLDAIPRESLRPLSRFRIDQGALDLRWAAAWAAARLAASQEQAVRVVEATAAFTRSGDERAANAALDAFLALAPPIRPKVDLAPLAAHPDSKVRAFAASVWADDPDGALELGTRFARDRAQDVRRRVARALPAISERKADLAARLRAILVADPSAEVRAIAHRAQPALEPDAPAAPPPIAAAAAEGGPGRPEDTPRAGGLEGNRLIP